jgi:AraC-like DNA-binding protein
MKLWQIEKDFWQFVIFIRRLMMYELSERLFLRHLSRDGLLEKTRITREGHMELLPRRSYVEGTCLLKQAGKSLVITSTNLNFRQPVEHSAKDQPEYFYISLCLGSSRSIAGAYIGKDKIYRQNTSTGFVHCGIGVAFLPEFFDTFLNSRHGISSEEIVQAFGDLGKFPLIPDAAVILKQIGGASFTDVVGNVWIEAKALELVSVILDWHRRFADAVPPHLKEHDRQGIAEAIRYAEEHLSGPLALDVLAKQAAMSVSKFTAVFKTYTGLSTTSYIRRLRMDKAMDLLKNTTAPLSDIAALAGYKHQSRFSTLFREQFGVMPSIFRKRK